MKSKRKTMISIIAIMAILVLCMVATFGMTLAFFGGNDSGDLETIKLKTGIEINASIDSTVGSGKVVPGQPVKIEATGTVNATTKGQATASEAVDGIVRAKFNIGDALGKVTISGAQDGDVWVDGNNGYFYLTEDDKTTLRQVSRGTSVKIYADLQVSSTFMNSDSGKSVDASVTFEVVQSEIYGTDGELELLTLANALTSGNPINDAFNLVAGSTPSQTTQHAITISNSFTTELSMYGYNGAMDGLKVQYSNGTSSILYGNEGSFKGNGTSITFSTASIDEIDLIDNIPEAVTNNYGGTIYTLKDKDGTTLWTNTVKNGVGSAESFTLEITEDTELTLVTQVTKG